MALAEIIRQLVGQAQARPGTSSPPAKLAKGLSVAAMIEEGALALCLFRDATTMPSRDEAITCGETLRWYGPVITEMRTARDWPALLVQQAPTLDDQWCPGLPMAFLPARLPVGTLCGLSAAGDWVTVIRYVVGAKAQRQEELHWRFLRGGHVGEGREALQRQILRAGLGAAA